MTKELSLGTPEGMFVLHPDAPKEPSLDAVVVILNRMQAIVELLGMDGVNFDEGFQSRHDHVMNAIDCLDGLIDQARKIAVPDFSIADDRGYIMSIKFICTETGKLDLSEGMTCFSDLLPIGAIALTHDGSSYKTDKTGLGTMVERVLLTSAFVTGSAYWEKFKYTWKEVNYPNLIISGLGG